MRPIPVRVPEAVARVIEETALAADVLPQEILEAALEAWSALDHDDRGMLVMDYLKATGKDASPVTIWGCLRGLARALGAWITGRPDSGAG